MKENTKQILKVSICTLVALALFVGVILMCIYFAFVPKGVADAYNPKDENSPVRNVIINYFDYVDVLDIEINEYIDNSTAISQATKISFDEIFRPLILGDSRDLAFPLYYVITYAIGNEDGDGYGYTYGFTYTTAYSQTMNRFNITNSTYSDSRYCYSYDCYVSFVSSVPGQVSIDSLYITCYYTSDEYVYDAGYESGVIDTNENNQVIIDELQAELNRYKSAYESIGWFDVLSSSLNNVSLIDIDGYKSTFVDVKVSDGVNNLVNVWNLDENSVNGTAFAVVLPRFYGTGTRFRFTYRGLTGSVSGMQNVSANLGYINSTGNLISIMQLPSSVDSYVEFNISEEMNTFVIYTTGNLILFEDFKFQVFSFDELGIYDDGFADGKDEGIKYGEQVGYEKGYSDARDKYINNDYSFFALFSSVLDAPLQMIIGTDEKPGMLNFYIPGLDINIAPFLLSLFSVALVITIIRFILARAS